MREKYPLALAASIILVSFGVVVYLVSSSIVTSQSSDDEDISDFQDLWDDASGVVKTTSNKTTHELTQLFDSTREKIKQSQEYQRFQQLIENTDKKNTSDNER